MSVSPGYLPAIMFTGSREESTEFSEDGTKVSKSKRKAMTLIPSKRLCFLVVATQETRMQSREP